MQLVVAEHFLILKEIFGFFAEFLINLIFSVKFIQLLQQFITFRFLFL